MDHTKLFQKDGIQPDEWENLSLGDLTHLNCYVRNNTLKGGYQLPFLALNVHWAEALSPGIPDGRYVKS